ncbi:alcohol/choline dehydrogenase [Phakopsora pachyrhizi]|nr:alcohol/choline dehydrogenase [Phakopsora pachyrhizi]
MFGITIAMTLQYPLSRGSTHISSQNPEAQPNIDPKILEHPFDNLSMIKASKHARKIMSQSDFKDFILDEKFPGPTVKTDEDWLKSVRERVRTEYHPMGTGSMISENLSGVVNPKLIVHGTKNMRVFDVSITPIPIAAHQAFTVYLIAEKASELIKNQYYKIHSK